MLRKVAIAKLESQVIRSMKDFLEENNFAEVFPPKIVKASGACENIDTLFEAGVSGNPRWFCSDNPRPGYLSQTAQLYLEAFTPYMGKVYSMGPSFRAEEGNDNRHLIEFLMLEIEFEGGFKKLLQYIEKIIFRVVQDLVELSDKARETMRIGKKETEKLRRIKPVFPRITYDKAIEFLGLSFGSDISSKNEQKLVKEFAGQPLFITHFPNPLFDHGKEIEVEKFFNMVPDPSNPKRVLSADLILPFSGEAVGAAQRVWKSEELKWRLINSKMFKRLKEKGGGLEDFKWYLKRIREKSVLHSGCGFGIARVLKFIKRRDDIKEVVTFPSNQENII